MKNKGFIILILAILLGILTGFNFYEKNTDKDINKVLNSAIEEVKELEEKTEEKECESNIVKENESSTEIVELTLEDEKNLEEQEVEDEVFQLQGEIAYEGDRAKSWNVELGDYIGLTYYSQIDSRWKNLPYTSINDSSQTIGSSACGPTCAAMVVSSIKGNITPVTMANLFVENGYRSANNGTYWSAYRAVADEFDIGYTEISDFDKMITLLKNNYYVVASCGNGLFTTGGHYIFIYGIENNTLKIYDPYLYSGKFETSTRRGKAEVIGNTVYCSLDNFRNYSNYKGFFCYKYDENKIESTNVTDNKVTTSTYTRYVKVNSYLNVRNGPGTNNLIVGKKYNGDIVTILDNYSNWSKIDSGWICSDYLVEKLTSSVNNASINNTAGNYYRLKNKCYIYSKSSMSGKIYTYLPQTQIKVLSNINNDIDYVQVIKTGRKGYIYRSNYTNVDVAKNATTQSTVGKTYKLKVKTTLYSNSNLTGIKYTYLPGTTIKVIKNVNSNVDYAYIPATGRYAYIKK